MPFRVSILAIPIMLAGLLAACGDDKPPTQPSPPTPGTPAPPLLTVTAVTIAGPGSVQPPNSAQFTATLQLEDGTERAATSARWGSSNSAWLSINATTGVGVANAPLGMTWNEVTLSVEVSLAGTGLTGQTRGSREILVQPDGTFRIAGAVTDADSTGLGVPGAILEVRLTEDLASPRVTTGGTDAAGQYRLYGVPAESYLHVRRPGYVPVTERIHIGSHTTRDFHLRVDGNVPSFEGTYTMTVDATNCTGFGLPLPSPYRLRTYTATIRQSGARLAVALSDARFDPGSDHFSGVATLSGADMDLRSFYNPWENPSGPEQPDVVELLADGTALLPYSDEAYSDRGAVLTGTPDRLSGTLLAISQWRAPPRPGSGGFLGGCSAPRLTLERR